MFLSVRRPAPLVLSLLPPTHAVVDAGEPASTVAELGLAPGLAAGTGSEMSMPYRCRSSAGDRAGQLPEAYAR
jgi:hypothetical protein